MASIARLTGTNERGSAAWYRERIEAALKAPEPLAEVIDITPELAAEMLSKNKDNRHLKPTKLEQFKHDIEAGKWQFNGEPLIVARDGQLNDGQHRLQAIIMAGVPVKALILFGLARESRTTIDIGSARSAQDFLAVQGVANAALSAAIARKVISYDNGRRESFGRAGEITVADILDFVKGDEALAESATFAAMGQIYARGLLYTSEIGFMHYVLTDIDKHHANRFLTQTVVGENIARDSAPWTVRRALARERLTRSEKLLLMVKGWNAYRGKIPVASINLTGLLPRLDGDMRSFTKREIARDRSGKYIAAQVNRTLASGGIISGRHPPRG